MSCSPKTLAELARTAGLHVPTVQSWWSRQKAGRAIPVEIPKPTWTKAKAGVDLWDYQDPTVKKWVRHVKAHLAKEADDGE